MQRKELIYKSLVTDFKSRFTFLLLINSSLSFALANTNLFYAYRTD